MKNNTTEVITLFLYSFIYYMHFSYLGEIEERNSAAVQNSTKSRHRMLVYSLSMYWVINV